MNNIETLSVQLVRVLKERAELEEKEKKLRNEIASLMVADRKKLENNRFVTIRYKEESTRTSLDTKALEKKYPDVYADVSCWKESTVKPYILVKLKNDAMLI